MNIDSVITLENGVNCLLLEKVVYDNKNYFLSVVLDEEEEPSDEYVIFNEIIEDNEAYVEKVEDTELIAKLVNLFSDKVRDLVANLG